MRLTLFNAITVLVMALTVWMAVARFRYRLNSPWFLVYYLAILGYAWGFQHSLIVYWVYVGLGAALLLRLAGTARPVWTVVRGVEPVFFGYVLWRGVWLLMGW